MKKIFITSALVFSLLLGVCATNTTSSIANTDEYTSYSQSSDSVEFYSASTDDQLVIRVGLYYSSSALATANLLNSVGSGHEFGYYNSSNEFVSLGYTSEEAISMLKDTKLYINSDGTYTDTYSSSAVTTIGQYKVQLDATYSSFDEASAAASNYSDGYPAYVNGAYKVRIGTFSTSDEAKSYMNTLSVSASVVSGNDTSIMVSITTTNKILFSFDNGMAFGIRPMGDDTQTWFKGYKYRGGFAYIRNGGNITVVNYVGIDDYVKGVIPYEVNPEWDIEVLKVQALCARSYAVANINRYASYGFDVTNSTDSQVYRGTNSATTNSDNACDETAGEYVVDANGDIITSYFHSSNGGATEDSENVWNEEISYLRGVYDNFEDLDSAINGYWQFELTNDLVEEILAAKNVDIGEVTDIYVKEFTDMGNVYTLAIKNSSGEELLYSKEKARTGLNGTGHGISFSSQRYTIENLGTGTYFIMNEKVGETDTVYAIDSSGKTSAIYGLADNYAISEDGVSQILRDESSISDTYLVSGTGWGHNVGLSQNGALAMAALGYSYEEIIKYYYTGVEVVK